MDPITTKTDCKKVTMDVPLDVFLSVGRIRASVFSQLKKPTQLTTVHENMSE